MIHSMLRDNPFVSLQVILDRSKDFENYSANSFFLLFALDIIPSFVSDDAKRLKS